MAIITMIH